MKWKYTHTRLETATALQHWSLIRTLLRQNWERLAFSKLMDLDDVRLLIADQSLTTWFMHRQDGAVHGVLLTQTLQFPKGKVVRVSICSAPGGSHADWSHCIMEIEEYAKELGAAYVEVCGRPGWARELKGSGYTTPITILRKEL